MILCYTGIDLVRLANDVGAGLGVSDTRVFLFSTFVALSRVNIGSPRAISDQFGQVQVQLGKMENVKLNNCLN